MYKPPDFEYYVLIRNDEYQIISIVRDNDPLYGYGTWDLFSGPFNTWDDAEMSVSDDIRKG